MLVPLQSSLSLSSLPTMHFKTASLVVLLVGLASCSPMLPGSRSNKGKGIVQTDPEQIHYENMNLADSVAPFDYQNWNIHDHTGASSAHPSYSTNHQTSPHQNEDWNLHGNVNAHANWRGDTQPYYGHHGAQQANFNLHDQPIWQGEAHHQYGYQGQQEHPDAGLQHQQGEAGRKPTITTEGLNKLMHQLFHNSDSEESQKGDETESDQDNIPYHEEDPQEYKSSENEGEMSRKGTSASVARSKRQRVVGSKRYQLEKEEKRFRQIWADNGLSTDMPAKDLAKGVLLMRLGDDKGLGSKTIGRRAAQVVKEEKLEVKNPDRIYAAAYRQYTKYFSTMLPQCRKELELMGVPESEIEGAAIQKVFDMLDRRDASMEKRKSNHSSHTKLPPYRQSKKDARDFNVARVAQAMMNHLHSKNMDIDTVDKATLALESLEVQIPDMDPSEAKKYMKIYLEQNGLDKAHKDLYIAEARREYARQYSSDYRRAKKAANTLRQLQEGRGL